MIFCSYLKEHGFNAKVVVKQGHAAVSGLHTVLIHVFLWLFPLLEPSCQ